MWTIIGKITVMAIILVVYLASWTAFKPVDDRFRTFLGGIIVIITSAVIIVLIMTAIWLPR